MFDDAIKALPSLPVTTDFYFGPFHMNSLLLQLLVVTVTSSALAFWQWIKVLGLQVIHCISENCVML
jgi:hypothetical protein